MPCELNAQQNMRPDGFDEALQYHTTKKIPLGSWDRWLRSCYTVVEKKYHFNCTWASLLGLTAGMLRDSGQFRVYAMTAKNGFNRTGEMRFLLFFVGAAHVMAGGSQRSIKETYRGEMATRLLTQCPDGAVGWSDASRTLRRLATGNISPPIIRDSNLDFQVYLLHGFYITSRSLVAMERVCELYQENPHGQSSLCFKSLANDDDAVKYFSSRAAKK